MLPLALFPSTVNTGYTQFSSVGAAYDLAGFSSPPMLLLSLDCGVVPFSSLSLVLWGTITPSRLSVCTSNVSADPP